MCECVRLEVNWCCSSWPTVGRFDITIETELPARVQLAGAAEADQTDQGTSREGRDAREGAQHVAAAQPIFQLGLHRIHLPQSEQLKNEIIHWYILNKKKQKQKQKKRGRDTEEEVPRLRYHYYFIIFFVSTLVQTKLGETIIIIDYYQIRYDILEENARVSRKHERPLQKLKKKKIINK